LKIALELQPLVVDGDERPAMPEVAALMNHAKEKIKLSFATENKKTLLKNIIKIIEKRWVTQMDHPLYGAALYLNPGRLHSLIQANDDATVGSQEAVFLMCLEEWWRMKKLEARLMLNPWTMKALEEMHSQTKWPSKTYRI